MFDNFINLVKALPPVSFARAKQRYYKYGSDYFNAAVLPKSRDLIDAIGVSHADASLIFDTFVKIDTDGSGEIEVRKRIVYSYCPMQKHYLTYLALS